MDRTDEIKARIAALRDQAAAIKGADHFSKKEKERLLLQAEQLHKASLLTQAEQLKTAPPPHPRAPVLTEEESEEVEAEAHQAAEQLAQEVLKEDEPAARRTPFTPEQIAKGLETRRRNAELRRAGELPPRKKARSRRPSPPPAAPPPLPPSAQGALDDAEHLLQRLALLPHMDLEIYVGPRRERVPMPERLALARVALVEARALLGPYESSFATVRQACSVLDAAVKELS